MTTRGRIMTLTKNGSAWSLLETVFTSY